MSQLFLLGHNAGIPNNPRLAAEYHPAAFGNAALGLSAAQVRQHLRQRDWVNTWQDVIYDYHHYHTSAHEVLVVLAGTARVVLGGQGGPTLDLGQGDLILLPAGVGHCSLGHSPDFLVMGAYAAGRPCDLWRAGQMPLEKADARIAQVPDWQHHPL